MFIVLINLGLFDFDKQNRKGAPKDFGIRRIAGGLADYATLGITDFGLIQLYISFNSSLLG